MQNHRDKPGVSLAFFRQGPDRRVLKVSVRVNGSRLRMVTIHGSSAQNAEALLSEDLDPEDHLKGKRAKIRVRQPGRATIRMPGFDRWASLPAGAIPA